MNKGSAYMIFFKIPIKSSLKTANVSVEVKTTFKHFLAAFFFSFASYKMNKTEITEHGR